MTGPLELPMWAGFRRGPGERSSGAIDVRIRGKRATTRQRAAVAATVRRAKTMKPILLDAIVAAYPTFRAWRRRPKTIAKSQLRDRIELFMVQVTEDHFEGIAYVAYEFLCAWDPSGFVVLTHRDRIVATGQFELLVAPHADPARVRPKPRPKRALTPAVRAAAVARERKNPKTLELDDREMPITLAAWAGFGKSRGDVRISYGGDAVEPPQVGAPQQAAYRHTVTHATAMQRAVLDGIVTAYPKLVAGFDSDDDVPATVDRAELAALVSLVTLHVHSISRGGLAYVGYELRATWDAEHGVGVLTHGDRVIEVGGADTAILCWIAERARKRR